MYYQGKATLELGESRVIFNQIEDGQVEVTYEVTEKTEMYPNPITANAVWEILANAGFVHIDPRPYYKTLSEALTQHEVEEPEEAEAEELLFAKDLHKHFN